MYVVTELGLNGFMMDIYEESGQHKSMFYLIYLNASAERS